jgi:hypothetical protein
MIMMILSLSQRGRAGCAQNGKAAHLEKVSSG